jgi:hypothetical protein
MSAQTKIATVLIMRENERSRLREVRMLEALHAQIAALSEIQEDIDDIQEEMNGE